LAANRLRPLPKPFIGLGRGPSVCFASALTPRSFPTHDPHGNCPTTPHVSRHMQESRRCGRTPESMHDPLGLHSAQVLLFWHRDGSGSVTSHVKRDRSCHWAYALLLGHTQATGGSIVGARPGATVGALRLGCGDPGLAIQNTRYAYNSRSHDQCVVNPHIQVDNKITSSIIVMNNILTIGHTTKTEIATQGKFITEQRISSSVDDPHHAYYPTGN
jgi:hypothetical protein